MTSAAILGSGIYLPKRVAKNAELEDLLNLEAGFIESRTGIQERRWSQAYETVEYMAAKASLQAVRNAKINSIDAIIIARDAIITKRAYSIALPIIENLHKAGMNTNKCFAIDVANYCPGFIYATNIAQLLVKAEQAKNVLVVASTNYRDLIITDKEFNSQFQGRFDTKNEKVRHFSVSQGEFQSPHMNAFLWGCGAGAIIIGASEEKGIYGFEAYGSEKIRQNSYGVGENDQGHAFAALDGQAIYKYAITEVPPFIQKFLEKYDISPLEIQAFIPHQPNPRILKKLSERIPIPKDRILVSCDTLGNMIGSSIPITYHLARNNRKINSGDTVFMCSFGDSYLTSAGLLFQEQ